jgi:hypothetical protein
VRRQADGHVPEVFQVEVRMVAGLVRDWRERVEEGERRVKVAGDEEAGERRAVGADGPGGQGGQVSGEGGRGEERGFPGWMVGDG